jgi:hypothetical protein
MITTICPQRPIRQAVHSPRGVHAAIDMRSGLWVGEFYMRYQEVVEAASQPIWYQEPQLHKPRPFNPIALL